MIKHIVIFKYKPGALEGQIRQMTKAFQELQYKIPGILSFEHGVNISPEHRNLGFTDVYELSFANLQARDAYLPHPAHCQFNELLGQLGIVEDVFVVDYAPQSG